MSMPYLLTGCRRREYRWTHKETESVMHRTIDDQPNARVPQGMLWLTAAVLLAAAGYYLGRGFYALTFSPDNFPIDLRLRWAEQRYIVRHGQDPFDLYFHNQPEGPVVPPRPITRNTTIDPDLGPVLQLAYPPPLDVCTGL